MTAAHRELPLGAIVRVTNLENNQSVMVRINDHGPFYGDRIIDLSLAAAKAIGVYRAGTAKVRLEAYAPPAGYDPAGRWCVQIGAFLDEADAIQLKNDLMSRYATAKVTEFAGATGHWVLIKPQSQDKATAMRIADGIHIPDPGAQPYLVRLN
jgi:rare lipoprotein A